MFYHSERRNVVHKLVAGQGRVQSLMAATANGKNKKGHRLGPDAEFGTSEMIVHWWSGLSAQI